MKVKRKTASLPDTFAAYAADLTADELDELRVLLYVLSKDAAVDTETIKEELKLSETAVVSAVSYWRGAGLVRVVSAKDAAAEKEENTAKTPEKAPENTPEKASNAQKNPLPASVRDSETRTYTAEELADLLSKKPELASLLDFAQRRLEKVFSPSDIAHLVYLEDYVLLSPPMIMRIIDYCVEAEKKSMRYVEKTALALYDEGITDYEALEAYFERKKNAASQEETVRRITGIRGRGFTAREKECIGKWFSAYGSSEELIALAYEKTVNNIAKPSLPYMTKLLEAWSAAGLRTPEDVKNRAPGGAADGKGAGKLDLGLFDEASSAGKKGTGDGDPALNLDDFFENT